MDFFHKSNKAPRKLTLGSGSKDPMPIAQTYLTPVVKGTINQKLSLRKDRQRANQSIKSSANLAEVKSLGVTSVVKSKANVAESSPNAQPFATNG